MMSGPYGIGSNFDVFEALEPALIGIVIALLVFYLIFFVFAIVSYVLRSVGLYTIAKRRGIHNPWLAWLPIGDAWIMGSISDQYQYVAKGKIRNRRKVLLGLNIALFALVIPVIVAEIATIVAFDSPTAAATAGVVLAVGMYLAYFALTIVTTVFLYIAQYDMYRSCNPDNAVMFLVLGIFFNVTQPFFIFACRKKDLGMPPRKKPQEPTPEIPEETVEPVEPQESDIEEQPIETEEQPIETEEPTENE